MPLKAISYKQSLSSSTGLDMCMSLQVGPAATVAPATPQGLGLPAEVCDRAEQCAVLLPGQEAVSG